MKALTNILTHMLMLLLMLVVMPGCTNDEMADIVVPTDEGLVQLTVSMSVPELKLATRADEGEALTSITALAFDANKKLIKISTATDITPNTFKVSVTDDTSFIHFLANTNVLPTNRDIGKAMDEVLISLNTQNTSLAYWGHHHFDDTPSNCTINFYRNQAKIEIVAIEGYDGELAIAGVMNALDQSSLVPYNPELEGETYAFNPTAADKKYDFYTLPTFYNRQNIFFDEEPTSCYVFEHPNTGNSMPESLIVICNIGDRYYKVALGESSEDDGMVTGHYYPIIRNHKYLIQVADTEDIDTNMGAGTPEELAEDSSKKPINDDDINVTDIVDVPLQVSTAQSSVSYAGTTFDVMVNNLGSVNTLTMTLPEGIADVFEISNNADLEPTINGNARTYNSSNIGNIVFTFTMKEEYIGKGTEANKITFTGEGGEKVNVLEASTTLALIPFANTYEMWFNDTDGTTEGAIDYADNADHAKFFYNREGVSTSSNNAHEFLETNLYGDAEAEQHNFCSMSVGSGSQITFTIPDERYLTLMVAKNNSTDTWMPAIDLSGKLADGNTWSTALSSATPLATNHNFGAAGEISKKGRIIRYKLAAGTYTLTGNNAPYWLYYMRVSKEKTPLQEVRQLEDFTYELTWNNNNVGDDWMYEEKHPEATTYFYVQGKDQKQMNFKITSSGSYTINSSDFSINNQQVSKDGSVNLQRNNNAGKFTVTGTTGAVSESDKYYHFYENYTTKRDFEIRNPFRVGLYRDTNWSTHSGNNADRFAISSLAYGGTALVNFIGPFATAEYSTRPKFQVIDWTLHGHGDQFVQISDDSFELKTETYIADRGEWQPHPGSGWGYVVELGKMTMDNNYKPENRDLVVKVISEESGMSYGETNRIMGEERTIVFTDVFQPSLDVSFCSDRNGTNLQTLKSGQQFYIKLNVHESIPAIDRDGQSNRTQIVLDLQCPGATLAVTDNNTPHRTDYDGQITNGSFTKNNDGKFVLKMGYRTHTNDPHKVYEPITEYYLGLTPTFESVTEGEVGFTIDSDNFTIEKLTLGEHTETLQVERDLTTVNLSVNPNNPTIDYQNNKATTLTLTKPAEVTSVTIQLASNIFNVTTQAAALTTTNDGQTYTLTDATVTEIPLTFTLKEGVNLGNITLPVNITFSGQGTDVNVNQTSANIDVSVTITAGEPSQQTLYYDSSNEELKKTTVRVTVPAGVKNLNITGADIFTVSTTSNDLNKQSESDTSYTINDATRDHTIDFTFTATAAGTPTIRFNGSGDNIKVNSAEVRSVVVKATPTLQIEASADKVYLDDVNKSITITATVPDEVPDEYAYSALASLTLAQLQSSVIFDVEEEEEDTSDKIRTYTLTLKESVTAAPQATTITISGTGNDYLKVPTKELVIGVGATRPTETKYTLWANNQDLANNGSVLLNDLYSGLGNYIIEGYTIGVEFVHGHFENNVSTPINI